MKLAVIGLDDEVLDFIERVVSSGEHRLSVAVATEAQADRIRNLDPRARTDASWESLIAMSDLDAVVVARNEDQELHDEQLRKLAQAGMQLIVSHPSCSAIFAYELEMISTDTGSRVVPLYRGQSHPALQKLRQVVMAGEDGPLGALHRIEIERRLPSADEAEVTRCLALDAALTSQLIGQVNRVSAVSTGEIGQSLREVTVHLIGQQSIEARWSITPINTTNIRLVGASGEATLWLDEDPTKWHVESTVEDLRMHGTVDWDPTEPVFGGAGSAAWQDACRDLEIAETALVSLRRRRTLDVYGDPPTEEDAFKGFMAIGSCLLLLLVLLGFGSLAIIEGIRLAMADPSEASEPHRWPLIWRLWPVYPLLAFLALQFLLLVARRSRSQSEAVR